ncbi:cuticle protein 19-like [Periplaneta americana]|uniref:cuticle protein 19-like n=1 Tax=Periplaneta americana TaxID=6978 RepID=UPI0037E8D7C1
MAYIKVALLLVLVAAVIAKPGYEEHNAHPQYEFKYGVQDGHTHDIKEQAEKRDGDKVEGYYKLVEPDGTTRTVHYTADKHNGFNAHVQKSGHASHPQATHHVVIPSHSHGSSYAYNSQHESGYGHHGSY